MSNPSGPFTPEKVLIFFEELSGKQFIDAETKRPVLELIEESKVNDRSRLGTRAGWLSKTKRPSWLTKWGRYEDTNQHYGRLICRLI